MAGWRSLGTFQGGLVLLLALWLSLGLPLGYSPEWAWPLRLTPAPFLPWAKWLLWFLGGWALAWGLFEGSRRLRRVRSWLRMASLGWLVLWGAGGSLWAMSISAPLPHWLVAIAWSPISNEYFSAAYEVHDWPSFLASYPQRMASAQYHLATHPPGSVGIYWLWVRLYEGSPWLRKALEGWLEREASWGGVEGLRRWALRFPGTPELPPSAVGAALFSSLAFLLLAFGGVASIYAWLRQVGHEEQAWRGALMAALLPALCFFGFGLDGVLFGFSAALCALWERTMGASTSKGRWGWAFTTGLLWGVGLSLSLGLLALFPLWLGVAWLRKEGRRPWAERVGGLLLGAGLLGAGAMAAGVPAWAIVREGLGAHRQVTLTHFRRTYWIWLGLNGVDVALFVGLPLFLAWLAALWRSRKTPQGQPLAAWGWALLGTLLLIDLAGVVRAEVGRIWMFLYPPLVAHWAADQESGWKSTFLWQGCQLALMLLWMPPLVRPF